jgi:hypothetical protein
LGSLQFQAGNAAEGGPTFGAAVENNFVATAFTKLLGDFAAQDIKAALADQYALLDYCYGVPLDRQGANAADLVSKQNTGTLKQRECYSGYHAPHGSGGLLVVLADLLALNGETAVAKIYYDAAASTRDYPTWPLKGLVERRRAGETVTFEKAALVAGTCGSCHSNTLP